MLSDNEPDCQKCWPQEWSLSGTADEALRQQGRRARRGGRGGTWLACSWWSWCCGDLSCNFVFYRATKAIGYEVPPRYKMVQDFTTNFLQLGDHLRQVRKHQLLVLAIAKPVISFVEYGPQLKTYHTRSCFHKKNLYENTNTVIKSENQGLP